jgi:hypothetical protein
LANSNSKLETVVCLHRCLISAVILITTVKKFNLPAQGLAGWPGPSVVASWKRPRIILKQFVQLLTFPRKHFSPFSTTSRLSTIKFTFCNKLDRLSLKDSTVGLAIRITFYFDLALCHFVNLPFCRHGHFISFYGEKEFSVTRIMNIIATKILKK